MQIREKGKKLLLIRTEYSTEKKRTFGKTIASQDKSLSTIEVEVRQLLSKEEVDQLEKWLSSRSENESVDNAKNCLACASYSISRITDSLIVDSALDGLSNAWGEKLLDDIEVLKKALRKAGIKRTRQAKEKAVDAKEANPKQVHIED